MDSQRAMPNHPAMEADLQTALKAMKRAAEAMVEATESIGEQFHGREGHPAGGSPARLYTYHALEKARAEIRARDTGTENNNQKRGYRASGPMPIRSMSESSDKTGRGLASPNQLTLARTSPPSGRGDGFMASKTETGDGPDRPGSQTSESTFGAQVVNNGMVNGIAGTTALRPAPLRIASTPTSEWPITNGSTPTLTYPFGQREPPPVMAPPPNWQTHGPRSSGGHVDLVEAAERFKQNAYPTPPVHTHPKLSTSTSPPPVPIRHEDRLRETRPQLHPHQPYQRPLIVYPVAEDEPSPILQIRGHTYYRSNSSIQTNNLTSTTSTEDFHTTLLTNQVRRPMTSRPLSRVHPSFRSSRPPRLSRHPSTTTKPSTRPAGLSLPREILFVLLICLSQLLMLAGISQALVPATLIGASFPDTTPGSLAWYSASYGLTAGTFVLPAGRLGDLFGHKKIFIIGFAWFGIWSLAAGFADMVEQTMGGGGTVYFCLCRGLQGIGPALLVPNGQAMLGRTYGPGSRKNMVMSLFGAAAPAGFVVGAVMSSLLAERVGWPWGFWCMAGACGGLGLAGVWVVPGRERAVRLTGEGGGGERTKESLWKRLDGPGIVLGVSGLVLFNFAFNQAPIVMWTTPYTYFILIIAVLLLAAFIYNELVAPHPLVPIAAMKAQTNFVLGCTAAGWGCFSVWVYYALATIQNIRGWSPLLSSAAFAHAPLSGFAASMLTAYLMGRIKPHWIMFISMVAFFIGSILLAIAPVDQSYWYNTFFGILVMPFGMDMSNPAATIILSNSVPKEHQGIAASLVVTVVNYSISLALGFGGTLEVHVNEVGASLEKGYRGAQYLSVGLGGLGVVLAAAFLAQSSRREKKERRKDEHLT